MTLRTGPQPRRRVLMVGPGPDRRGGISSVVTAYRDIGLLERWDVEVIATHCDGGRTAKMRAAAAALLTFTQRLVAGRAALVHVHMASRSSFWRKLPFCVLARLGGLPLIVHVHGGGFADFHARGGRLRQAAIEWCLGGADTVAALSPRWAARLAHIAGTAPIAVLPNPLPAGTSAVIPYARQVQPDRHHLVFLGQLSPSKGVLDLLHAFALVLRRHPSARLTLAGQGDLASMRSLARSLGVEPQVSMPGWMEGDAKMAMLAGATLFVLPSHAEGVPMSILEAQVLGIPVLATNVGGVPDIIEHAVNGWLVPPRDGEALATAAIHLLDDPLLRRRLAAAGSRRARAEHASGAVVARLDLLYSRLLRRSSLSDVL